MQLLAFVNSCNGFVCKTVEKPFDQLTNNNTVHYYVYD